MRELEMELEELRRNNVDLQEENKELLLHNQKLFARQVAAVEEIKPEEVEIEKIEIKGLWKR